MPTQSHTDFSIDSAVASDLTNTVGEITVDARSADGVTGEKIQKYYNSNFTKWYGYYRTIPQLKIALDFLAMWTLDDGVIPLDSNTKVILESIRGWGNDTFDSILENQIIMAKVNGDSYAQRVTDKLGNLINIKPLNPERVVHLINSSGLLIGYEYLKPGAQKVQRKFEPEEILHLTNRRVADEVHGVSDIEAIEKIILADNESFVDVKKLMHRHVRPLVKIVLDTDDTTEIATHKATFDAAIRDGENLYIPKGVAEHEIIAIPSNSTLNPMPWRQHLRDYYWQVFGIPQIIVGSSGEFTESTAKIAFLSWQRRVKSEQRYLKAQLWQQLFMRVDFKFSVAIQNELISDDRKDGRQSQTNFQQSDLTVGPGSGT